MNATNGAKKTTANISEERAWKYARSSQGYEGTLEQWLAMSADERAGYEAGAAGIPTSEAK